jgi:ribosome biogenesis protein
MSDSSGSDNDNDSEAGEQIRVTFKLAPEVTDRSLEVPSEPIAVPAAVGRKGLAAVINHLLDRQVVADKEEGEDSDEDDDHETDKLPSIPFDFVLKDNNRLLRSAVEREARRYGLSLEKPLALLYFPAPEAPELEAESKEQPDWISCLSYVPLDNRAYLCSASYDGSLRIYQPEKEQESVVLKPIASTESAHRGAVKCLSTVVHPASNRLFIASGSMDHTLVIHSLDPTNNQLTNQIQCFHEGYSSAIASLDFVTAGSNKVVLASGDWDGNLALWDMDQAVDIEETATKRTKTSEKQAVSLSHTAPQTLKPKLLIPQAHYSQISGLSWGNLHKHNNQNGASQLNSTLITGSWDHSIKSWDVERQECVVALNGSKVVACLDTSYHSEGIVATGHPDCNIRLWDVRTNGKDKSSLAVSDKTFRPSHKEWVTAVQWSPQNPYHLASTSHDGTVKVRLKYVATCLCCCYVAHH